MFTGEKRKKVAPVVTAICLGATMPASLPGADALFVALCRRTRI